MAEADAVADRQPLGRTDEGLPAVRRHRACAVSRRSARQRRRAGAMPLNCAGMTLVSLKTSRSPGPSSDGRSRTMRSSNAAPGLTTSSRAASRGSAGRSAIRSSGRSKSKRSTRTVRLSRPAAGDRPGADAGDPERAARNVVVAFRGLEQPERCDDGRNALVGEIDKDLVGILERLADADCRVAGGVRRPFLAAGLDVGVGDRDARRPRRPGCWPTRRRRRRCRRSTRSRRPGLPARATTATASSLLIP